MKTTRMTIGVVAIVCVALAGWLAADENQFSPEQQKRLDVMKTKGVDGSLTVLPVRIGGQCWDRLTEVVGTFFEKQGLQNIELGKTEFKP
jgi:hypothetical protein